MGAGKNPQLYNFYWEASTLIFVNSFNAALALEIILFLHLLT